MELDPSVPSPYIYIYFAHAARGEFLQAIDLMEKAASFMHHPQWTAHVGMVYGLVGRFDEAAAVLAELTELAKTSYVSPFSFATVYLGMGDVENWKRTMLACLEERNALLVLMDAPWNDSVRHDPFFAELRSKVGLPEPRTQNLNAEPNLNTELRSGISSPPLLARARPVGSARPSPSERQSPAVPARQCPPRTRRECCAPRRAR